MATKKTNRNRSGKPQSDLGRIAKAIRASLAGRSIDDVSHVEMMAAIANAAGTTLNVALGTGSRPTTGKAAEPTRVEPTPGQIALLNNYPDIECLGLPDDVGLIDQAVRDNEGIGDTLFRFLWMEIGETGHGHEYQALERAIEEIRAVSMRLPDDEDEPYETTRYAVIGCATAQEYEAGKGSVLHTGLTLKTDAFRKGWDAAEVHAFVMLTDGRNWWQAIRDGATNGPWHGERIAPGKAANPSCAAGMHSWIDRIGRLHPSTKCDHCEETYGHPS